MSMSQITVQKGKNGEPDRERKVFYFENDKEKPILAAGILFVKEEDGNKFILMQKVIKDDKQEQYSDFGGKIDKEDKTLIGTISRELGEELNYGFYDSSNSERVYLESTQKLKRLIQENIIKKIYQDRAKYFLIIAKLPEYISLDFERIGDFEELDKINRTVEWVSYDDFLRLYKGTTEIPNQIHPRLWGRQILGFFSPKKFGFTKSA